MARKDSIDIPYRPKDGDEKLASAFFSLLDDDAALDEGERRMLEAAEAAMALDRPSARLRRFLARPTVLWSLLGAGVLVATVAFLYLRTR